MARRGTSTGRRRDSALAIGTRSSAADCGRRDSGGRLRRRRQRHDRGDGARQPHRPARRRLHRRRPRRTLVGQRWWRRYRPVPDRFRRGRQSAVDDQLVQRHRQERRPDRRRQHADHGRRRLEVHLSRGRRLQEHAGHPLQVQPARDGRPEPDQLDAADERPERDRRRRRHRRRAHLGAGARTERPGPVRRLSEVRRRHEGHRRDAHGERNSAGRARRLNDRRSRRERVHDVQGRSVSRRARRPRSLSDPGSERRERSSRVHGHGAVHRGDGAERSVDRKLPGRFGKRLEVRLRR